MSYLQEAFLPHLRLSLLKLLASAPGYCANGSILQQSVGQLGLQASRDQVNTQISWLGEQQLVTVLEPAPGLFVATLTGRGSDVQAGLSTVPGVQKPSPR
jgi:hypothetical protein